jgi:hypothetical protein
MNEPKCLALLLMAVFLCGCANDARKEMVQVKMNATQRNAGKIAQAMLVPRGDNTSISLVIGGVPSYTTRPVRLYTYIYPGTCANQGASPAFGLNRTLITDRRYRGGVWWMSKSAPVSLATLRASDYSLVLRTTPADGNYDIFCGDIR